MPLIKVYLQWLWNSFVGAVSWSFGNLFVRNVVSFDSDSSRSFEHCKLNVVKGRIKKSR